MGEIIWQDGNASEKAPQQPLGRMLVPVGQSNEEPPKKKRRRKSDGNERRRLIIHIVILVVLLGIIGFGLYSFLHEEPRQGIPQPNASSQVDSATATED